LFPEWAVTGTITGRNILLHPLMIVREFGVRCYARCLKAMLLRERKTFLDCAFRK
jgi:hypothetical protein